MAENDPFIANVANVVDLSDGKRVTVEVRTVNPEFLDSLDDIEMARDNRARIRALIGAGFAKKGFVRNLDIDLQLPKLKRRTEIVSRNKISDDVWTYTINVRGGMILG